MQSDLCFGCELDHGFPEVELGVSAAHVAEASDYGGSERRVSSSPRRGGVL